MEQILGDYALVRERQDIHAKKFGLALVANLIPSSSFMNAAERIFIPHGEYFTFMLDGKISNQLDQLLLPGEEESILDMLDLNPGHCFPVVDTALIVAWHAERKAKAALIESELLVFNRERYVQPSNKPGVQIVERAESGLTSILTYELNSEGRLVSFKRQNNTDQPPGSLGILYTYDYKGRRAKKSETRISEKNGRETTDTYWFYRDDGSNLVDESQSSSDPSGEKVETVKVYDMVKKTYVVDSVVSN